MPSFRQNIRVFTDANLSPAAMSAKLAQVARKALADAISNGAPTAYRTFVDNLEGGSEDQAKQRIRYEFTFLGDAAAYALERLQARSPVGSGRYRDSFFVAVNGRPVPAASFVARSVPPDAEIFIYNSQPYSRKIDVQFVGTKQLRFSTAPNLFDDAARDVKRRFGNTTNATRLYTLDIPGAYKLRKGAQMGKAVQSPALQLSRKG